MSNDNYNNTDGDERKQTSNQFNKEMMIAFVWYWKKWIMICWHIQPHTPTNLRPYFNDWTNIGVNSKNAKKTPIQSIANSLVPVSLIRFKKKTQLFLYLILYCDYHLLFSPQCQWQVIFFSSWKKNRSNSAERERENEFLNRNKLCGPSLLSFSEIWFWFSKKYQNLSISRSNILWTSQ